MAVKSDDVVIKVEDATQQDTDSLRSSLIVSCRKGDASQLDSRLKKISADKWQQLLNTKDKEGTTPLHEACRQGNTDCTKILLQSGADAIMWDVCGFSPIHTAAYNGHIESISVLLKWEPPTLTKMSKCDVDEKSRYGETALHIACFKGHFDIARSLVDEKEASLAALDRDKNTVLHYATSSNNSRLLCWLLSFDEVKEKINATNNYGQTVAHRAAILGCVVSVSVLKISGADFNLKDRCGHSALDFARLLNNKQCYDIAVGNRQPLPLCDTPQSARGASFFMSSESLQPQRSVSNGSAVSALIPSSSPQFRRHNSITRRNRPISHLIARHGSLHSRRDSEPTFSNMGHRRSSSNLVVGAGGPVHVPVGGRDSIASIVSLHGSTDNFRYTSRETLATVEEKDKKSKSCQEMEMKLLFASMYEPPPDLHFIHPLECEKLSAEQSQFYSKPHDIFLRIPTEHWQAAKDKEVEVRICATMGLNPYPDNYVIVSPVCFISCRSKDKAVTLKLKLPHAASIKSPEYRNKACILSTISMTTSQDPTTPLFAPTDRKLRPLPITNLEFDVGVVEFTFKLPHPALFAVAVACAPMGVPRMVPVPLRCKLYVLYKIHDREENLARVYVHAYVAMRLKTVETHIKALCQHDNLKDDGSHFLLNCPSVQVSAKIRNSESWEVNQMDNGLFEYHQVALSSQALDVRADSISHDHPYPLSQGFFIEPRLARGAIKCDVIVTNTTNEKLTSVFVVPYSPTSKDASPEPSSRTSTAPPSPTTGRVIYKPGVVIRNTGFPSHSVPETKDEFGTMV